MFLLLYALAALRSLKPVSACCSLQLRMSTTNFTAALLCMAGQ